MEPKEFVFDYVHLWYYICHKINLNHGGSYIDSPDLVKTKKASMNPFNKEDNKCFRYAVTAELNHEKITKDPQIITKIKSFINKYKWEGISFPSKKNDWKKTEKYNLTIALYILITKNEKIYPAYVLKHNSNSEKQNILLKISNREKLWDYLAVKILSALLRGITYNHCK